MRRWMVFAVACMASVVGLRAQSERSATYPYCQILDGELTPLYAVSLGFLPTERFEGYGRSALVEFNADRSLAYLYDILGGDIDLTSRLRTTLLMDSAGLDLPDQLVELSVNIEWTLRTLRGSAYRVNVRPGLYSDLEEFSADGLFFPFSLALIQSFTDRLSGVVGLQIRPGFDRVFRPEVGVVWQPVDIVRVQAGLPDTRAEWFVNRDWSLYAGFEWRDTSYELRPKSVWDRGRITLEDYRLYAGASRTVSDEVRLIFELGQALDRRVSFERDAPGLAREVDIENGLFLRVGIVGPF